MALHLSAALLLTVFPLCLTEVRVNLTAVVGSSITFSDPVKERGFLNSGRKTIASIYKGAFEIEENLYLNRLHWSSSGLFTLSDLQKSDSGVYSIDSKKGTVFTKYYELKLYDPVSVPVVSCVNVSVDSLSLQCSVSQTEQTTLSWFRGERPVDTSHSGALTVHRRDYDPEYKCVAQNPADTKTTIVKVTTVCEINERPHTEPPTRNSNWEDWVFLIPLALFGVALAAFITWINVKTERH